MPSELLSQILLECDSAHEATRRIFYTLKSINPVYTLGYITKQTSLKSRGFFSEVLNGKKLIDLNYIEEIATVFKLNIIQKKIFIFLWQLEHEKDLKLQKNIFDKLNKERILLGIKTKNIGIKNNIGLFLKLYAYLNLMKKPIPIREIYKLFEKFKQNEINQIISLYVKQNFAIIKNGTIQVTDSSFYIAPDQQNTEANKTFILESILDAKDHLNTYYDNPRICHFESTFISVNRKEFEAYLPEFRRNILSLQNHIDSANPDMVVSFNLQLYPSFFKKNN